MEVHIDNFVFQPAELKIKVGTTVTWTNKDSVGHDVTGAGFKSGAAGGMQQGDTFKHKFTAAGTFKYRCTVHPNMKGAVIVK
jgi:amicyanin